MANITTVFTHLNRQLGSVDGVVDARMFSSIKDDAGVLQSSIDSGRLPSVEVLIDKFEIDPSGQLGRMSESFSFTFAIEHTT